MEKRTFPTEVVLGCVAFSKLKNPVVHSEVMLPFIQFLSGESESILRRSRAAFVSRAVVCSILLAQKYPALDKVSYPERFKDDDEFEAWLKKQYAIFGKEMEVEAISPGQSLTDKQRETAKQVGARWLQP